MVIWILIFWRYFDLNPFVHWKMKMENENRWMKKENTIWILSLLRAIAFYRRNYHLRVFVSLAFVGFEAILFAFPCFLASSVALRSLGAGGASFGSFISGDGVSREARTASTAGSLGSSLFWYFGTLQNQSEITRCFTWKSAASEAICLFTHEDMNLAQSSPGGSERVLEVVRG